MRVARQVERHYTSFRYTTRWASNSVDGSSNRLDLSELRMAMTQRWLRYNVIRIPLRRGRCSEKFVWIRRSRQKGKGLDRKSCQSIYLGKNTKKSKTSSCLGYA